MSARIHFGHCVGCDKPIRPPYLSFELHRNVNDGNTVEGWEEADICDECAAKMTAAELFQLFTDEEEEAAA